MTLYIVRHPETKWNKARRMQGHLDSPLTPAGRAYASQVGTALMHHDIRTIWSSDLGRCRETAGIIGGYLQVPIEYTPAVRERNFGDLNGQPDSVIDAWIRRDDLAQRPPGGETLREHGVRVLGFVEGLLSRELSNTLLVTHSGSLRAILARYYASLLTDARCQDPDHAIYAVDIDHTGIVPGSLEIIQV